MKNISHFSRTKTDMSEISGLNDKSQKLNLFKTHM